MPTKYSRVTYAEKRIKKSTGEHDKYVPSQRGKVVWYHNIGFQDGSFGKYGSLDECQTTFVVGRMAFYTIGTSKGMYPETVIHPAKPIKSLLPENKEKINEQKLIKKVMDNEKAIIESTKRFCDEQAILAYDAVHVSPSGMISLTNMGEIFTHWCLQDNTVDKKEKIVYNIAKIKNRGEGLKRAIMCAKLFPEFPFDTEQDGVIIKNKGIKTSDDILIVAQHQFDHCEAGLLIKE